MQSCIALGFALAYELGDSKSTHGSLMIDRNKPRRVFKCRQVFMPGGMFRVC